MALKRPYFVDNKNQTTNSLSAQVKKMFDAIQKFPFLNYQIIKSVEVSAAGNKIPHALGREPIGYLILRRSHGYAPYDTEITDKYLLIKASVTMTLTLVVF